MSNELPRRPDKIQVFGKHVGTTFLNNCQDGQSLQVFIEKVGLGVYELTLCVYDNTMSPKDITRKEFVTTLSGRDLRALERQIKEALG